MSIPRSLQARITRIAISPRFAIRTRWSVCGVEVRVLACQTGPLPEEIQQGLSPEIEAALPIAADWLVNTYLPNPGPAARGTIEIAGPARQPPAALTNVVDARSNIT